jgi:hypothetical protein
MGDSIDPLARSFERHLRAESKAERTIGTTWRPSASSPPTFEPRGGTALPTPAPKDIEGFLGGLLARHKPGTGERGRSMAGLWKWLSSRLALSPLQEGIVWLKAWPRGVVPALTRPLDPPA